MSAGPALRALETTPGGSLQEKDGRFVVTTETQGDIEANQLAEGLHKIATLTRLLQNGVLTKDSILFWDAPEANLNPSLIRPVVAALQALAAQGVLCLEWIIVSSPSRAPILRTRLRWARVGETPMARVDELEIHVDLPAGWELIKARQSGPNPLVVLLLLTQDAPLSASAKGERNNLADELQK